MNIVNISPVEFFSLDDFMYFQQERLDDNVTDNEVKSVLEIIEQQGILDILDIPCGYGRHSKALMRLGHRVTGVDLSPSFIEQANIHNFGERGRFYLGEMDDMPEAQFDLIIILFNSFGYYPHDRNSRFIKRCASQLKASGEIVIDTINADTLESSGFMNSIVINKGDESLIIEKERSEIQYEQGVSLQYKITSFRRAYSCRTTLDVVFYNPKELENMLYCSGFKYVNFYSGLSSERNWEPKSKKMVVVAKK